MPTRDKYGNNCRRAARVRSVVHEDKREGEVMGTGHNNSILVKWDDSEDEELVSGSTVVVIDRSFR